MIKLLKEQLIPKSIGAWLNFQFRLQPEKALVNSLKLFVRPRKGRYEQDRLPAFLEKAEISWHTVQEVRFPLYELQTGFGQTILLVHGWESNAGRWEALIPYLAGFNVYLIDAPAHGQSSGTSFHVPLYAKCVEHICKNITIDCIVGHSVGGTTALFHQAHSRFKVPHLISLGAPIDMYKIMRNYAKLLSLNEGLSKAFIEKFEREVELKTVEFDQLMSEFPQKTKGILAHDKTDEVVLFDELSKIQRFWKTPKIIITKDLGHSMHDEELYRELRAYIIQM